MRQYYAKLDAELADGLRNVKPLCSRGCAECCSYTFAVTGAEYGVIREFLRDRGADTDVLRLAAARLLGQYERDCPADSRLFESGTDEDTLNELAVKRFKPCIFLNGGSCSIYDARPIICRIFGVVHSRALDPQCKKIIRYYLKPRLRRRELTELRNQIMIFLPGVDEMLEGVHYVVRERLTHGQSLLTERYAEYARAYPLFRWAATR